MPFQEDIDILVKKGKLPEFVSSIMKKFYSSYVNAITKNGYTSDDVAPVLSQLLKFCVKQISHPYRFEPYHKSLREPVDYYKFGNDFIRPLIRWKESKVLGQKSLQAIESQIARGENVVFLANHQIEPDPQAISLLLEKEHPKLAEEMVFVAGHRVITDPLAVPFSLGRNLICIYSKRHIENPPEQKAEKLLHNQRAMKKLGSLLSEGGKCIYVAPSGGRDRPDAKGTVQPAEFDPQSVELFHLVAKSAKSPTHFYPLALATYKILPPPSTVEKELGEKREANAAPIHLNFGVEVQLDALNDPNKSKQENRAFRAQTLTHIVRELYYELENLTP
jgi:glycerol-3-phosphate O-acyltransferase